MALRYYFEWHDTENSLYRVEIFSDLYTGASAEITGYATYSRESDDLWQPLQVTALDMTLIADSANPLEDLWQEDDRYWMVKLKKGGSQIFVGHISTDEIEQPFVSTPWEVSIECRDPLGFLEDLAFVDSGGLPYTGTDTVINTIAKAVKRGFRDTTEALNFRMATYLELPGALVFQQNAYVEMDAFTDDNDEPQSCKDVVEAMLEAMGCIMFMREDYWIVINVEKYSELITTAVNYIEYTEDGGVTGSGSFATDATNQRIGSHIAGASIYHVNKNQSFIQRKYIQSVRIKHTYEYRDQIIPNGELIGSGGGPYTMDDWTLQTDATALADGVDIDGKELVAERADGMNSTSIKLKAGNKLKFTLDHSYVDDPIRQDLRIELDAGGGDTYYLFKSIAGTTAEWKLNAAAATQLFTLSATVDGIEDGDFIHEIDVPDIPADGDLTVYYLTPVYGGAHTASSKVTVNDCLCEALEDVEEGIEHTAERTDNDNGRIPEVVKIRFATADTSVIKNTFFTAAGAVVDGIEFDGGSEVSSLRILADSRLLLGYGTQIEYNGDVKGKIQAETPKRIDVIGGNYLIGSMSKNLQNDTANVRLLGYNKTAAGAVVSNSERIVYKQSVKPKIK